MTCRLADDVRIRKEDWGLLFYSISRHKVCFVRSGRWLSPTHFDGTWSTEDIVADVAERTGAPAEIVERTLPGLTGRLAAKGMITS